MELERCDYNIEAAEAEMLKLPQVTIPVKNYFTGNGLYARDIIIPAGTLAVGHAHKHEFMEVFISGTLLVPTDEGSKEIHAPYVGIGKPDIRKIGMALTDCRWITFHTVPEGYDTVEKMEEHIIKKSDVYLAHEKEVLCQSLPQQ